MLWIKAWRETSQRRVELCLGAGGSDASSELLSRELPRHGHWYKRRQRQRQRRCSSAVQELKPHGARSRAGVEVRGVAAGMGELPPPLCVGADP
jgi:hypothetical protein